MAAVTQIKNRKWHISENNMLADIFTYNSVYVSVYSKLSSSIYVYVYDAYSDPTVKLRPKSLHTMQTGRTDIKFTGVFYEVNFLSVL